MTSIATALQDLLSSDEDLDAVLDRHFRSNYRQRTNGAWSNRSEFREHIEHLRSIVAEIHVEVVDELRDGLRYAERHIAHVTKTDGAVVVQEVYVFARLDQSGRFECLEEVTLMLKGDEADRHIGSARS